MIRSGIAVEAFDGVPDGVELFAVFNAGLERRSVLDESLAGFSQQHLTAPGIGFALGAEAGLLGFEFLERGLQRRAVAEFLALDGIIKLVARGENSLERKILPLRKGIVFVVVTAGAGQGQPEERGARGVDPVSVLIVFEFAGDHARFLQDGASGVEAGGETRVGIAREKFVAGDLLLDETVERFVGVERTNDVVAIAIRVAEEEIGLEAAGVGVARDIEPVAAVALAVLRRGEEAVDKLRVGVGGLVGEERLDFFGRGRQTDEIERSAADEGLARCAGGGVEFFGCESREDEAVDGRLRPRRVDHCGKRRAPGGDEGPVFGVVGALRDPVAEGLGFGGGERPAGVGRRHMLVLVLRHNAVEEFTLGGFAGTAKRSISSLY